MANLTTTRSDAYVASNPKSWQISARTRIYCANVLYKNYQTTLANLQPRLQKGDHIFYTQLSSTDFLMLYGMAVENLVKGILVASCTVPFVGSKLNPAIDTHDLNLLFNRAHISRTKQDRQLLDVLSDLVESGKYPVAKALSKQEHLLKRHPYARKPVDFIRRHALEILTELEAELRRVATKFPGVDNPIDLSALGLKP